MVRVLVLLFPAFKYQAASGCIPLHRLQGVRVAQFLGRLCQPRGHVGRGDLFCGGAVLQEDKAAVAVDVGNPLVFRLVDMPGYGYAKAPKDVVKKWRFLVNDYLRGRAALKRALVLIDSRHGIKDVDTDMLDMLDGAAVSYRIVLTKSDKIKASELVTVTQRTADAIRKRPAAHPEIIATSSEKGMGIPELRAAVLESVSQG